MALIKCSECSKEVSDTAGSCPGCGAPINKSQAFSQQPIVIKAPKSRSLSVVLALFLGSLGIHKFYLNRPGWGVIYFIFCWTFIPAILGFIEALNYLFMSDQAFQSKYSLAQYINDKNTDNTLTIKNHESALGSNITENKETILQTESISPQKSCTSCSAQISIYEEKCSKCGAEQLTKTYKTSTAFIVGNVIFGLFIVSLIVLKVFFLKSSEHSFGETAQATEAEAEAAIEITSPDSELLSKLGIEITDCSAGSLVECTIKYSQGTPSTHGTLKSFSLDKNNVLLEERGFPTESIYPNTSVRTVIGYAPAGTQRIEICYDLALIGPPNCQRPEGM